MPTPPDKTGFTAVIPTKNRPALLEEAVSGLTRQSRPPAELIVVDQSADDEGRRRVERLLQETPGGPRLDYVWDPSIDGVAAARNVGLERTRTPWVVFLDDDGVPGPEALERFGRALEEHPELLAVCGIVTSYRKPPLRARLLAATFNHGLFHDERQPVYWNWRRYPPGALVPTTKLNGGLMAFRREALLALGGFCRRYVGSSVGEDCEVAERLLRHARPGESLAMVGGAWLAHESLGDWKAPARALEFELVAASYRHRAGGPGRPLDSIRWAWMMVGLGVRAAGASVRRRSLAPIHGLWRGLRCVWSDFRDCPFLKPPPGELEGGEPKSASAGGA